MPRVASLGFALLRFALFASLTALSGVSCSDDAGKQEDATINLDASDCCSELGCGTAAICVDCACVPSGDVQEDVVGDVSSIDVVVDTSVSDSDAAMVDDADTTLPDSTDAVDTVDPGPTPIDISWPSDPSQYKYDVVVYLSSLQVPALDERNGPTCCKDFGAISKDHIVAGTDAVDNGLGVLFLKDLGGVIDTNGALTVSIQSGGFVQLLEHKFFDGINDPDGFVLTALPGQFEGTTTFVEAAAGTGTFLVDPIAFEANSGRPATVFNPSAMAFGELTTTTSTFFLTVPLGGATIAVPLQAAQLFGHAIESTTPDGKLSLDYSTGWLAGYILLDDFRDAINTYIDGECACLGLTAPLYGSSVQWEPNACLTQAEALARCPNPTLNETGCINLASGLACEFLPGLLRSAADIAPDGQTYTAISSGFEFVAVPATVVGLGN